MFKILIHVFQKDFICILIKYYFHVFNIIHVFQRILLHLMKYYFMCLIIIHSFQMDINCILMFDHN